MQLRTITHEAVGAAAGAGSVTDSGLHNNKSRKKISLLTFEETLHA